MRRTVPWHLFPALLLTVLLWPASAIGEGVLYDAETVLSVVALTKEQRALAEWLYQPILAGETRIDLPEGTCYEDVSPAMRSLSQDYPELFHLGHTWSIGYERHTPDIARYITPEYRMDVAQTQLLRRELYAIARDLAARYPDAEQLHDTLVSRVSYRYTGTISHTAAGALLYGEAVCEGYAQALTLLYRTAGIPCGMVSGTAWDNGGTAQAHAWNIADLNGPALIDATWNDQETYALTAHWYYGLSTQQMSADHTPAAGQTIPLCGDQANWHRVRGMYAAAREDVYRALSRLVSTGEMLNLRFTEPALYEAFVGDAYGFLGAYNDAVSPEEGFYGGYSVVYSDAQQCVVLWRTE